LIEIPDNIDSKYRFVILSALRARQIQSGSPPMIEDATRKPTQTAMQEVLQNLVEFTIPGDEEASE
jgi:DNA-directed RNA polymerase omega subunit